jgi:hypothetical protein
MIPYQLTKNITFHLKRKRKKKKKNNLKGETHI